MRKIIHIDMDAFYASVEQRDEPAYRGKPIVVGGPPESRGVVATASYEARKFGVRSAMSSRKAYELCPHAVFVKPRFDVYKSVSNHLREIFSRYTDIVEPLSLDEAFLDVTSDKQNIGSAITIAEQIRKAIATELQLTASAGVSINKFVAKIASDMQKPDGLTFIGPSKIGSFMESLPVGKFFGVGKVTAAKMNSLGLFTGADLKKLTEQELTSQFGKSGGFFYQIVRGIDDRPVQPNRETKSVGAEDTFPYDLVNVEEMHAQLDRIAASLHQRLLRYGLKGRTVTLKIKYADFRQITRSYSFGGPQNEMAVIIRTAKDLLAMTLPVEKGIRLLGISMSNFNERATVINEINNGSQLAMDF